MIIAPSLACADYMNLGRDIAELEAGGIANPDEGRQVGHYWLRAPELSPNSEIREQIERTQASILQFSRDILKGHIQTPHGENFSDLLLIGIGGSALGPQFIADALAEEHGLRPHFMDNTDSDGIDLVLNGLGGRLARTLVLVISKSGGTAETRNGMLEAQEALVSAQDALTAALVDYRVAELELQRDMGVLGVDEKGLWHEYVRKPER